VKPSNILIQDGAGPLMVKVADFGVAKALVKNLGVDRPRETGQGLAVGSPAYMSPEQIRADGVVGPPSDTWALAVVAYEAITAQLPFFGKTETELAIAIATTPHDPPSKLRRGLPSAVDKWFECALAKEPEDRFATMDEMARAFAEAIATKPRRSTAWIVAPIG